MIDFQIAEPGHMTISVYNIKGQKVRTLFDDGMSMIGDHKIIWDGKNGFGKYVSTGLYFVTIRQSDQRTISKKVLFLK
jgi:flagellar hook assembly protein FlgD